jgi:hypothetical protein
MKKNMITRQLVASRLYKFEAFEGCTTELYMQIVGKKRTWIIGLRKIMAFNSFFI